MDQIALPYFVASPSRPSGAGLVVLHEGNGISPQLLRFGQRMAGAGLHVVIPDLFFRSGGTESGDVYALMQAVTPEQAATDLRHAAGVVRGLGAARVGVLGFCFGGTLAWNAAGPGSVFDAAVAFYGSGIAGSLAAGTGPRSCPTLAFFGGRDEYIPRDAVDAVAAAHEATVVYPEAGHGFMRDGSEHYRPEEAADAWDRTLAHLTVALAAA